MQKYQSFNDFVRHVETNNQLIIDPQTINEFGTQWVIGYQHIITCDYEFEQYKNGITQQNASLVFDRDIYLCELALQQEFENLSFQYDQLSLGSKKLLLLLFYHTGNIKQFDKLILKCQEKNGFYEALKLSGRKNVIDRIENEKLQERWEVEKQYFMNNFTENGLPKNPNQDQVQLLQTTEDLIDEANFLIQNRYRIFNQQNLAAFTSSFTNSNYLNKEFIEFIQNLEGKKYQFASFNETDQKWYPVEVPDQTYKIIGFSHICTKEQEKQYQSGLETKHVNYLFLMDYQEKCIILERYLEQYHPEVKFDKLSSQVQLFLIEISFRNLNFHEFKNAITLALQNKVLEAIDASNIFYKPNLDVYVHQQERIQELRRVVTLVDENYCFQPKLDWSDEKYNNIVGIKIDNKGFQFIFDAGAANKIKIKDLITCLKVFYDPEIDEESKLLYFSLEFEENDIEMQNQYQQKVYFPEYLEGTEIGEILYESDFILKQMSLGIEVVNKNPLQVQEFDYGTLPIQPLYKIDPDYFARLFLKYGGANLVIVEDQLNDFHSYTISNIELAVDAKYLDDDGQDQQIQDPENAAVIFATNFAKLYDEIAVQYPVFIRLKEVFMANLLAKHIYHKKVQLNYNFINEQFQNNLIPMYQKTKSPTLRMKIENDIMEFDLTGGVSTQVENVDDVIRDKLKQNSNVTESQNVTVTTKDHTVFDATLSRVGSASSISTQSSDKEVSALQGQLKCKKCQKLFNKYDKSEQLICQDCKKKLGLYCQKCQKFYDTRETILEFGKFKQCEDCIVCSQCNNKIQLRDDPHLIIDDQVLHNNEKCMKKFRDSPLRDIMITDIRTKFQTKTKSGDLKKVTYYLPEKCQCLQFPGYSGYIIGFYHPLVENKQTKQNYGAHYQISELKAKMQLDDELNNIEKLISANCPKENVLSLKLYSLFIMKDYHEKSVDIKQENNYGNLLEQIKKVMQCPIKGNHQCKFKNATQYLMQFLSKNFKKNGEIK